MAKDTNILLQVEGVGKKFCRDIRHNLYYCFQDILRKQVGLPIHSDRLRHKEFWALQDISFDLRGGELVAIVGMNGSGKTTLSRVVSGIFHADKGNAQLSPNKRITPIFALSAGLHPLFTGRENIYLKGAAYGLNQTQLDQKIEEIIAFSEIGEFMDMPVGSYSSGMRARLSYAIAMSTQPDVFVIDEALAVGDAAFRSKCFSHLREYVASGERAVIYVTNHIAKVLRLADRLLVLHKGELLLDTMDVRSGLRFYLDQCFSGESDERKTQLIHFVETWEG